MKGTGPVRILLVEDDDMLGASLQKVLRPHYAVNWVQDADSADLTLTLEHYDLILLDIGLPRRSGVDFLKAYRARQGALPVLILTARDTVDDRVIGLDAGADDYLVKPYSIAELQARVRALLRRRQPVALPQLQAAGVTLDMATHTLTVGTTQAVLGAKPFAIMQALLERPGAILSRAQLEERLYGWNEEVESNAVEVHIHSLRKTFGRDLIINVRGVGYTVAAA